MDATSNPPIRDRANRIAWAGYGLAAMLGIVIGGMILVGQRNRMAVNDRRIMEDIADIRLILKEIQKEVGPERQNTAIDAALDMRR